MAAAMVFAVLSALCNACSAILQRVAAVGSSATKQSLWKTALHLVRQPVWLLGALFLLGTFAFSALALYFGPLSVVQPILVLELIFTLAFRAFLLHDDIAGRTWFAALLLCLGLGVFLAVASPSEGSHIPTAGQWLVALSTRGAAVVVLLYLSRFGTPARRAGLLGAATAVVWSVDAAFVKQTTDVLARHGIPGLLLHWPLYGMIATGVLGTSMLQAAFSVGPLAASQATMLIIDPLASITLGIELFHEQLQTGGGAVVGAVLGLTVLAVGVVLLSVWAPPVMTAEELSRIRRTRATPETAPTMQTSMDPGSLENRIEPG